MNLVEAIGLELYLIFRLGDGHECDRVLQDILLGEPGQNLIELRNEFLEYYDYPTSDGIEPVPSLGKLKNMSDEEYDVWRRERQKKNERFMELFFEAKRHARDDLAMVATAHTLFAKWLIQYKHFIPVKYAYAELGAVHSGVPAPEECFDVFDPELPPLYMLI